MDEPFEEVSAGPDGWLEPEEIASQGVLAVAERFIGAIATGDTYGVWSLFSTAAQAYIINLGVQRGMDFDLGSRLRAGIATSDETDAFLGDLHLGLQRDLAGVDVSRVAFESTAAPEAPMQVRVNLLVQLGPDSTDLQTAIPAGAIVLSLENEMWRVERLVPPLSPR